MSRCANSANTFQFFFGYIYSSFPLVSPSFLPLHTYLVDVQVLTNTLNGDTRPPLHIGASRIVECPSGLSPGEFLIAFLRETFSLRTWLVPGLEEECS